MGAATVGGQHRKTRSQRDAGGRRAARGQRARRAAVRLARAGALLALALLAGCASTAPPDDLAAKIAQYYAEHASEEDGRCAAPEIASVTRRKVLASSGELTRLRVRYSYFDPSAPGAADWTRVLHAERECTGVAERDFTLVATDLGYKVIEMSGPVREQP
jgi:outer membrane murein-binding lipoprotein Lpp